MHALKSLKKTQMIYMCGFAATGALGLPKYYKPEKRIPEELKESDSISPTFRRLFIDCNSIRDIACGYGFTIIAADLNESSHSAVGFGLNTYSQIGYQAARPGFPLEIVAKPTPIVLPTKSAIRAVSCGRSHSLLLNDHGQVFALGNNSFGQCGRPIIEKEDYFGSKKVHRIDELPTDVSQIECGQDHSLFLTKTGELYACGWSADGQTGLGSYDNQPRPTKIRGDLEGEKIIKVSSSADTVLALDDKGNVFGWGNAEYAQFRSLTREDSLQFNLPRHLDHLDVPGKIIDVASGGTICAVLNDRGQVFVWGFGILGKGPNVEHSEFPALLPESLFGMNTYSPDTKVAKIFAGLSQFAAITNKGDLYAWGKNRGCSLGFAHRSTQYFPMQVNISLAAVKKVSLGIDHTCALVEKVI
jgi:alpha-tubulin suppressor-like RCC1 family protein